MVDLGAYKDKFGDSGLRVLEHALEESRRRDQNFVAAVHILDALMVEEPDMFNSTIRELSLDASAIRIEVGKRLDASKPHLGKGFRIAPDTTDIFKRSMERARAHGRRTIESADIFVAFSHYDSLFIDVMRTLGADLESVEDKVRAQVEQHEVQKRRYQPTYSAFAPDRAAYGRGTSNEPIDDSLNVRIYASHLAQLIAAKDTFMPLSIGLFGAWGSGKSHFIDLLDEELCAIMKNPRQVFYSQIVQIRFNAWHYLDTNLWANLASEIFDQLFEKLEQRGENESKQIVNLRNRLADQSALAAEAKAALNAAENVRQDAEEKLRLAMKARAEEEDKVGVLLDDLTNLAIDENARKELRTVAVGLGLPKVLFSFAELEARAAEVRSLNGRIKALVLALFTGPGWWKRGILLVTALAAPLLVAWIAGHGTEWMKDLLAGAGRTIAQVVTALAAVSAWLASQVKAGNALVGKLENAYDEVKRVRAEREEKADATLAQRNLASKRQAEDEARHTLREAEHKMKTIRADLAEMAPGRQLIRFLRDRTSAEDYRRHLGLVSLVRRDFEQLSSLLMEGAKAAESDLPRIDRIVLYIDDLDRCRADRVIEVLEAVHLLLAFPLFAVIVAVDPRWLRQSLLDHYPRLLGGLDSGIEHGLRRRLERPATPQDYLEKIFQVPFNLQQIDETGFNALVQLLFPIKESKSTNPDIRSTGSDASELQSPLSTKSAWQPAGIAQTLEPVSPRAPADPQRLVLTKKEVRDVQRCQLLFQTPRAVKRLANTYSLIRVAVAPDEWEAYLGPNETAGNYRVPLLLLAVMAGFPTLARSWLQSLQEGSLSHGWLLRSSDVTALAEKHKDTDFDEWNRLAHCLEQLRLDDWPKPESVPLRKWVSQVGRYSF